MRTIGALHQVEVKMIVTLKETIQEIQSHRSNQKWIGSAKMLVTTIITLINTPSNITNSVKGKISLDVLSATVVLLQKLIGQ